MVKIPFFIFPSILKLLNSAKNLCNLIVKPYVSDLPNVAVLVVGCCVCVCCEIKCLFPSGVGKCQVEGKRLAGRGRGELSGAQDGKACNRRRRGSHPICTPLLLPCRPGGMNYSGRCCMEVDPPGFPTGSSVTDHTEIMWSAEAATPTQTHQHC